MNTAIDALVLFLVLIVGVWTTGFGLTGVAVARSRGMAAVRGFALGATFGPAGLVWLWWCGRQPKQKAPDEPTSPLGGTRLPSAGRDRPL